MPTPPASRRVLLGAAATLPFLPRPVFAQASWPDRPVRVLVGFSAGGPTDTVARLAAQGMSDLLGQPVPVENRTGAAGNIATEAVARAPADGHTVLVANVGQIVINPHTYDRMPVDPMRDLVPVALMTVTGLLFAVHPSMPGTHAELVERLRREPGRFKYATSGAGGISHVVQELWRRRIGAEITPVHYRGAAAMVPEMLRGEPPMGLDTVIQFDQHIRAGALRGIVHIARERSQVLAQVPTAAEAGLGDDFVFDNWFGMFAPRGTPRPVIDRLVEANRRALAVPAAIERLAAGGMRAAPGTPEELAARCEREFRLYGDAIRSGGIRADS
jgi:tripartite-type tricarboxylate transporter receptor subunit TctC